MTAAADPRIATLADMGQCAYRLGMAFGAAAEKAQGTDQWLEYFHAFDRCFFSVRVGIALELRLERPPAASVPRAEPRSEDLRDRETLDDRDPPDGPPRYHPEYDRERDRETERASLPLLLRTLEGVVADAASLPGPEPAELPTLRELLARVKAQPPSGAASPTPARLAEPAAAPPQRRPASNVGEILAARRATGPPRR
jgi:hypothetical protein